MSDPIVIPIGDTDVCSICGLEVLVAFAVVMPPIEQTGGWAACPNHVDGVIARMQENVHELMHQYDGPLHDWWDALHPPPEPEPEEAA